MKIERLIIMLVAFLIMLSSTFTLLATTDRTPIYINIIAIVILMVLVVFLIYKDKNKKRNV